MPAWIGSFDRAVAQRARHFESRWSRPGRARSRRGESPNAASLRRIEGDVDLARAPAVRCDRGDAVERLNGVDETLCREVELTAVVVRTVQRQDDDRDVVDAESGVIFGCDAPGGRSVRCA